MDEIKLNGTQLFMGIEIPVIEGGFGKNQKVMLAKTVADIHDVRLNDIQELINSNIDEFEYGIDILDLCEDNFKTDAIGLGFITSNRQKHCYLLSEQGYMLLTGFMKTEKAKQIRKNVRREYFSMREVIKSDEQKKALLLLKIYDGGQDGVIASKELTRMEVAAATAPLIADNERMKPKEEFHDAVAVSENCISFGDFAGTFQNNSKISFGRNKIMEWCRNRDYLCSSYHLKESSHKSH